jgi:NAD(P) transhydrogenase subunit alpha
VEQGHQVLVEAGAGRDFHPDDAYEDAGAELVSSAEELYQAADALIKLGKPSEEEVGWMREGSVLISFLDPSSDEEVVRRLAEQGVTAFSVELIPRIGRAQSMDALSAMSSIAGYAAVLLAAQSVGRYLPMMTTAAGTTKAAKVMVLGVGVAGLQAIATARRLGAEVEAFDIRPEVADQVRSLGATFIEAEPEHEEEQEAGEEPEPEPGALARALDGVRALLGIPSRDGGDGDRPEAKRESDESGEQGGYAEEQSEEKQRRDQVVLTTALVPGKKAPTLVTREMVESMKPGAVLVDLAVEAGGNCELSEPGEVVEHGGVRIHGPENLPSSMPIHASLFFSRNMANLLSHLTEEGELRLDFGDEITSGACLTHEGEVRDRERREAGEETEEEEDAGERSGAAR